MKITGPKLSLAIAGLMAAASSQASGLFFYRFTPIADTQGGFPWQHVGPFPAMNSSGRIAFDGRLAGGVEGVFTRLGLGGIDTLADTGSTEFGSFGISLSINSLNNVAFTGLTFGDSEVTTSVLRGTGNSAVKLISDNDSNHLTGFCGLEINNEGRVVMRGEHPDGTHEIRTQGGVPPLTGVHTLIADERDGKFTNLSCAMSIAHDGTVAFTGHRDNVDAIWTLDENGLLTRRIDNTQWGLAAFEDVVIRQNGWLAFVAAMQGGGHGVFRLQNQFITTVMDPYHPTPPGVPDAVSMNESGTVAYHVSRGANGSDVFLGPNNLFGRIVGSGMLISNDLVLGAHISQGALNNVGQIVVSIDFLSGRQMIARGDPVNLLRDITYTGGLMTAVLDDGSVSTGTSLPTPPKGALLTFDLTFFSPGSRFDVKFGDKAVQSIRATDIGVRHRISVPLDPTLAQGGLQFVLTGAKGASAQISAITIPGLSEKPLDAESLSNWKSDQKHGAVVATNVGRYPIDIQATKGTTDPRNPGITPVSVGVLSDDGVDATADLVMSSLRVSGTAPKSCKMSDLNGDKRYDLLCGVELTDAVLKTGIVSVEALTQSGWGIEGSAKIGATRLMK
jgi:hypothetical protein